MNKLTELKNADELKRIAEKVSLFARSVKDMDKDELLIAVGFLAGEYEDVRRQLHGARKSAEEWIRASSW